jgi:two-component system CheB/CheR fusion protein
MLSLHRNVFEWIVDEAPLLIWAYTRGEGLIYLNRHWTTFTGLPPSKILGEEWRSLIHPEDQGQIDPLVTAIFERAHVFEVEWRLRHADGDYRNLKIIGLPRFTEDGQHTGYIGYSADITAEKIQNDVLKKAEAKTNQLLEIKSQFIAYLSHEVRNPIHAIEGMVSDLLDSPQPAATRQSLEVIHHASQHVTRLLDEALDLCRLESGSVKLEKEIFRFDDLVHDTLKLFQTQAQLKNIRLFPLMRSDLSWAVSGDRGRLFQILSNLISNALKYTDQGEVIVRVDITPSEKPHLAQLRLSVEDSGRGMTPDEMEKVFIPFHRHEEKTEGAGIGLNICHRIVSAMGGKMGVRSRLNEGSTFWVSLEMPVIASSVKRLGTHLPQKSLGLRGRVLIVEDDSITQRMLLRQLESLGLKSLVVSSIAEALDQIPQINPHLILTDYHLADGTGFELCRAVKEKNPRLPVICLTGNTDVNLRAKGLESGLSDFLLKPISVIRLRESLQTHLPFDLAGQSQGPQTQKDLRELYISTTEKRLKAIAECIQKNDLESIVRIAHQLASSSGSIGAHVFHLRSLDLEQAARAQQALKIRSLLQELKKLLRDFCDPIETQSNQNNSSTDTDRFLNSGLPQELA